MNMNMNMNMNEGTSERSSASSSHRGLWTLAVCVALAPFLYLTTLPLVEYTAAKLAKPKELPTRFIVMDPPTPLYLYRRPAVWMYQNGLGGFIYRWDAWCYTWLGTPNKW